MAFIIFPAIQGSSGLPHPGPIEFQSYIPRDPISSVITQSDGNSFGGDVVLDSLNMAYMDKDSILDQKYEKQIF